MPIFLERQWAVQNLPKRLANSHKGNFGTLTILAGSASYRGAATLAAAAALRAGTGIVRLASTEKVCAAVAAQYPCCVFAPLPEAEDGNVASTSLPLITSLPTTALLAGCGLGNTRDVGSLLQAVMAQMHCPMVLDADALNCLSGNLQTGQDDTLRQNMLGAIAARQSPVVLTPHIGEMARLCNLSTQWVQERQQEVAVDFSNAHNCIVVLKSHTTIVAVPRKDVYILQGNAPGLAKGGSGDVLAGILGSLLAQGFEVGKACALGVWLHAEAGRVAAAEYGVAGLSPADLPHCVAKVYLSLGR